MSTPLPNSSSLETFASLGANFALSKNLLAVVGELGYEKLTPIQAQSLPLLLAGKDVIGQSKTGSGKTAAFALPMLNRIHLAHRQVQALVLCPTRELAAQVVGEIRKLGRKQEGLQIVALTGGLPSREQAQILEAGVHIAVGTPGRVLDLIERERLDLNEVAYLVLDEADKMLDMGFEDEIKAIMKVLPRERQTVFFSATFPESIQGLSKKYQKNPVEVKIDESAEIASIEQIVYITRADEKLNNLMRVLQQHPAQSIIIFCNMKVTVNEVVGKILDEGGSCAALHGDLDQRERDKVMAMFRNGSHRILVATDVAARGLDIQDLELVVNFDLPQKPESYVHRIGRTGRAGKKGLAVSFTVLDEYIRLHEIEKFTGKKLTPGTLGFKNQFGLNKNIRDAAMKTIAIGGGRKDKLRPGDILGALTGEAGFGAADIGKIDIQDRLSFVAVSADIADQALTKLRAGRIKGHKFQIRFME